MKIYGDISLSEGSDFKNLTVDSGSSFPANPTQGELFYHTTNGLCVYTGTAWVTASSSGNLTNEQVLVAIGYTPLNKNGDNILGSLSFPKTSGVGVKIEDSYGWKDLIGDVSPKAGSGAAPTQKNFMTNIRGWSYSANDQFDCAFHIPHDYAPGTDLFVHVHWGHNGTNISGTARFDLWATYAKGHQQQAFSAAKNTPVIVSGLNIANTPQYLHRVDETQLSTPGGSASQLDTAQIEVDGLILISGTVTTIPSISGSATSNAPFIFTVDLHYQSTGLPTKNKAPNFYG